MNFPRSSGILLHPTSLPGPYGIGELGAEAHDFADFLRDAGQRIWQVLPLGPTGYGDSPYQCFSAFAGNPLLISIDALVERGYLDAARSCRTPGFSRRQRRLRRGDRMEAAAAAQGVCRRSAQRGRTRSRSIRQLSASGTPAWLDEFALFMALKDAHDLVIWTEWEPSSRCASRTALERARDQLREDIECNKFIQFEFERQWCDLKAHCARNDIRIMGDLPIYVALDSADVWANRELFELDETAKPRVVAGVPPDYFSATGQLWGNPIYRWEQHAQDWICVVDRALPPRAGDARHDSPRPLPRLRGVLRNSRRRDDGGQWRVGEGARSAHSSRR